MKKVFKINAEICDARKVQEETLAAYDEIRINSVIVLVSPAAQALLNKYPVSMNASAVLETEEDVQLSMVNGRHVMEPGGALPEGKSYLMVNGMLDVAPGCEELLKRYVGITVNGVVTCPKSLAGCFAKAQINGKLETYPDGAVLLKGTAVLDRTFRLRAREGALYHAARRVVALAPDIGFEALAEKNVRFSTKELFVAESLAEAAVPLFGDQTDIQILPDGCALVNDSAVLDETLLRRFGGKLYVRGDLVLPGGCAPLLKQISYLRVEGTLLAARGLEDAVHSLDAVYESLCIVGGTLLIDRVDVTVSRAALEQAEQKVAVIPGSAFGPGGEGYVRATYAASMHDLDEALKRLERFLKTL